MTLAKIKLEASQRLKASTHIEAAAVPSATKIKLLKELYKNASLRKLGLVLDGEAITGKGFDTPAKRLAVGKKLAELGWDTKSRKGVSRADGTWPLIIQYNASGDIQIEVSNQDTTDKSVTRQAVKDYKSIVKEVAHTLGVTTAEMKRSPGRTGAGAAVKNNKGLDKKSALEKMKKAGYGKPKVTGQGDSHMLFKKEHATVILEWSKEELVSITCVVI